MPSANCIYVESRIVRDTQLRDFIFPRDSNTTCYGDNVERRGPGINIYDTMFVFVFAFFFIYYFRFSNVQNFGRAINRSPPAFQACAGASASDRSPLTECPDGGLRRLISTKLYQLSFYQNCIKN